jgi:MFS transporter, YQGE family, putative transporter
MRIGLPLPRFQRIFKTSGFSREAVISLAIHACFQFGGSISFVFMSIYLWRLSQDISIIVLYNLARNR